MKATREYNKDLVKNEHLFKDPFYSRFKLRPGKLRLDEETTKTYQFPTFYGDVTTAIAIFTCSYKKAKELMPHAKIKPVTLMPGKALVIFSCYEYKNVLGIPGYNEIAMTIPVMVDPKVNIPILPMVMDNVFKKFGYYVFSMPVTSYENQLRGLGFWGLPKVVEDIDIFEENKECVTVARDGNGSKYFELRVPMGGKTTEFDVTSNLYSVLNKDLLQAETNFKASFNVNKANKIASDKEWLKLYDTPRGKILKNLEIDDKPFQFRFAKGMTACFDLPNEKYNAPFKL